MNLKLVAIDLDNPENFMYRDMPEGLIPGSEGQTLYFDGTDWVATSQIEIQNSGTEVRVKSDQFAVYGGVAVGDHQKILEIVYRTTPHSFTRFFALGMLFEKDLGTGEILHFIKSNIDLTGKYLKVSDNNGLIEFVDIPSSNIVKYVPEDVTSTLSAPTEWKNWLCAINVEANVTYELSLHLVFGNVAGRNGVLRLDSGELPFTYRPIITGNINSINDSTIIMRDTSDDKPDDLSNEAEYTFQTTGYKSSIIEMRGIFRSTVPIPVLNFKFRTLDNLSALVLKEFSYLKLSR